MIYLAQLVFTFNTRLAKIRVTAVQQISKCLENI